MWPFPNSLLKKCYLGFYHKTSSLLIGKPIILPRDLITRVELKGNFFQIFMALLKLVRWKIYHDVRISTYPKHELLLLKIFSDEYQKSISDRSLVKAVVVTIENIYQVTLSFDLSFLTFEEPWISIPHSSSSKYQIWNLFWTGSPSFFSTTWKRTVQFIFLKMWRKWEVFWGNQQIYRGSPMSSHHFTNISFNSM